MREKVFTIVCAWFAIQGMAWAQELSDYCGDPKVNNGEDVKWTFVDGTLTISGLAPLKYRLFSTEDGTLKFQQMKK